MLSSCVIVSFGLSAFVVLFSLFSTKLSDWLGRTFPYGPVFVSVCVGHKTLTRSRLIIVVVVCRFAFCFVPAAHMLTLAVACLHRAARVDGFTSLCSSRTGKFAICTPP